MRQSNWGAAKVAGFCLLALTLTVGGSTAATLTGMTVTSEGDVTRIHVLINQPVEWSHFMLNDPPRLYVDCRGIESVLPKKLPAGDGRAGKIEASVWKGEGYHALTRLTVELARPSRAEVKKVDDGLIIELGPVQGGEWTQGGIETSPAESSATDKEAKTQTHVAATRESTSVPSEMPPVKPAPTESTSIKPSPIPVPPEGTPVQTQASTATPESTNSTANNVTSSAKSAGPEPAPTSTSTSTGTMNPTLNPPAVPTTSPSTTAASSSTTSTGTTAPSSTTTTSTSASAPSTKTTTSSTSTDTPSTTTSSTTTARTASPTPKMVGPEPAPKTTASSTPTSSSSTKTDLTPAETMNPPATTTSPSSSGTSQTPGSGGTQSSLTPDEEEAPETTSPAPAGNNNTYRAQEPSASYNVHRPAIKEIAQSDEGGLGARGGARVSLDIQGADIYTVLRSISEYSGVNIVMGYDVANSVKNPVSFHLENVPWGEALEMVLRSAHLWYREEGNIIRVDTEENLRNEELARSNAARQLEDVMPLTTRIIEVVYANAAEIKPTIEKSLSKRGVVEVDERTNSLVVTDIRSRVEAAVEMIQHLDSQTPQVEIIAKLVDVDARFERDLGVIWNVSGVHADGASLEGDFGANDVVDPTAQVRFGLVRSWGTVSAVLSALERDNKADIISNPRITTVNNREARILVGKKIPLIVLDEAGNPVTELTTIGITLRVTPHINDQNRITLDMHPEVSDLSSQATVQGGVIINTSEADTRVMVGNGETAVIGGLIRANDEKIKRGVPILKDVPIVGIFFSSTTDIREKRELLIFVTPRIVTSFQTDGGGGE
jgi:type IV pilus assembly protein PilQ